MNEFDIIRRYFKFSGQPGGALALGVGDDCALFDLAAGEQLAITTDTLVSGVHFSVDGDPALIARRALRVNLSDIAAMGAIPLGFQLAIALPALDEAWLERFSSGLGEDAAHFACPLSGGDTTRGPLTITVTLLGSVPAGQALRRDGACEGDLIYVTGTLGDSRGGLQCLQDEINDDYLLERYWLPEPRLAAGVALRGIASAALDVSDGLVQDLGHIARASGVNAVVERDALPLSSALCALAGDDTARNWALSGGEDYELCFTVPPDCVPALESALATTGVTATRIGRMTTKGSGEVFCVDGRGNPVALERGGYDHFG